jgi:hypothetical protein
MTSPSKQLRDGALLGDVVESMTGHDVVIQRSPSHRAHMPGGSVVKCSHTSRAFAGDALVGTAEVTWEGTPDDYSKLLKFRMKDHLKASRARPINESYDPTGKVLNRHFILKSGAGTLHIHEKLFLKEIQLLRRRKSRVKQEKVIA